MPSWWSCGCPDPIPRSPTCTLFLIYLTQMHGTWYKINPASHPYVHLANQYVPGSVNCVLLSVNLITQYNLNYTDVASTHFKRVKKTSLPLNSQKPPYETLICVWFIIAQSRRQPEHQLLLWPRFEIRKNKLTVRLKQERYLFLPNDTIFAEHIVIL